MEKIAVHPQPLWRDRADFMIRAPLDDGGWEQIAARKISESSFEVCCIPFFADDLSLGDIVETEARLDARYVIRSVVQPSGHCTFRAWFGDSPHPQRARADLMDFVTVSGCAFEQSSEHMLAIDAPPREEQALADELQRREQAGELIYATGRR